MSFIVIEIRARNIQIRSIGEHAISFLISHSFALIREMRLSRMHCTASSLTLSKSSLVRVLQIVAAVQILIFLRAKLVANSSGRLFPVFPRAHGTESIYRGSITVYFCIICVRYMCVCVGARM